MLLIHSIVSAILFFRINYAQVTANVVDELTRRLSPNATISTNTSTAPRWSNYYAPQAGYVVNVAEALDVAATVQYCNENNIRFLAQSGGNGWANTFNMSNRDIIINLRGLNSITFSKNRDRAYIGGGIVNDEFVEAAYENGLQVLNGGCNCVGVLGSTLGGGVSRFMNYYGLPADNLISANLVTANGTLIEVSNTSNPDLLWAIRGAGANFGIVTSVEMNAYPTIDNGQIWAGSLTFPGSQLEPFINVINNLNLTEDMAVLWGFSYQPDNTPIISAEISYLGSNTTAGRLAFGPLYALNPLNDTTQVVAYNDLNADTDELCSRGGRKPGWHTGLRTLNASAFQEIWDIWTAFVNETGLYSTTVLVECYSNFVLRRIGSEGASYPHRDVNFYAWTIPFWEDEALDQRVEEYGGAVRDVWRRSSGFERSRAYINFAHGDEPLDEIYGESLPRLRELKGQWDPEGRFNQ